MLQESQAALHEHPWEQGMDGQAVPLQPQPLLLTFASLEGTVASPWCHRR